MRTEAEIQNEINKLRQMQPKVRPYTMFGDDNHAAINAQIEVLEEDLDENQIYDRNEDESDEGDWTQHQVDCALEAARWAEGEEDEAPSDNWAPLVRE